MPINYLSSFDPNRYNFFEIYDCIKQYYPIGIEMKNGGVYFQYPGIKKREKIIVENIHNEGSYQTQWINFRQHIARELNTEVSGQTYGQEPSFSASISVHRKNYETCVHNKALYFSVSVLGPYYQIYGQDTTAIKGPDNSISHIVINAITTSPFDEYAEYFLLIEAKIKEKYPRHKIIPYIIGKSKIKGLQISLSKEKNCTVYQALFNQFLANYAQRPRGDKRYGIEQWKKK